MYLTCRNSHDDIQHERRSQKRNTKNAKHESGAERLWYRSLTRYAIVLVVAARQLAQEMYQSGTARVARGIEIPTSSLEPAARQPRHPAGQ
jgi:hypothetical protein